MADSEPVSHARLRGVRRASLVRIGVLLAIGSLGLSVVDPSIRGAAADTGRVESAWVASIGSGAANGRVTVRGFDTGGGSIVLALRGMTPATGYAVAIHRGSCPALGTRIVSGGTFRTSATGRLSATKAVTVAQLAAIRLATSGTGRIAVKVGSGSAARCGVLAKSSALTPQVWFAPLPLMPIREWRSYLGSTDFAALFASDAPWQRVAGRTHVFKLYGEWIGYVATDTELRRAVAGLKARGIEIAIEVGPLIASTSCGNLVEGFDGGAPEALRLVRRVVAAGGTVRYLAMDEPLFYGSIYTGPNACRWSMAKVAAETARFVRAMKAAYPSIVIGDIEPLGEEPADAATYEAWMAAFRSAVGAPLPFFHLDLDYASGNWMAGSLRLQAYARGRGVRFGMIYNSALAASDAEWLTAAQSHILTHELDGVGPPDDAIFQSWTDHPDRVLPEAGPNTFTHLIADYARTRTILSLAGAASGGIPGLGGTLRTLGGQGIAVATVDLEATPRDGPYQILQFTGRVPVDAARAVIGVRVNQEGAGPGTANLTFYEFGYAEGSGANLVPLPHFEHGLNGWGPWGDGSLTAPPSDRGSGLMLRAVATPAQELGFNAEGFAVSPGSEYRLWLAGRFPAASVGSAYVTPIFLTAADVEVRRDIHPLAPAIILAGTTTTDGAGRFSITSSGLEAGRYRLRATYPGDAARWPAWAEADATVP
jgi:hypothetical protein